MLVNRLSQERIHEIIREAVEIEKEFISESLPVDLIGMNSRKMKQYIEYVADYWVSKMGYEKIYGSSNPFEWMDMIGMEGKTNFFEKRVGEYQIGSAGQKIHNKDAEF
jgi:ribonucleoside-diphosphate reductase beta chain